MGPIRSCWYPTVEVLRLAIASGKAAQSVYTSDASPNEHDEVMKILQMLRDAYYAIGGEQSMPFDMVRPSEY